MRMNFKGKSPKLSEKAFVAASADIIGEVELGAFSSVWFGATIRGDENRIKIGKRTSIQDNAVIHVDSINGVEIGDNVTIGHGAVIHGCKLEDNVLIGMNATVLNGAVIGKNSIVGANALVTEGKIFPENSLILGVPAKVKRKLTEADIEAILENAAEYVELAEEYIKIGKN